MTPQELKNSILQLAIQGRLVEQRPEEGTAEELYKKIQAEKQSLIKAGKLKKEKPLPPITDDEKPFEIPESWMWVHLNQIAESSLGKTLDKIKNTGELCPYLCSINVYWNGISLEKVKEAKFTEDEKVKYRLAKGDLLICEGGDMGRAAVWNSEEEMYYQNALHRVRFYGNLLPKYFKFLIECYKGIGIIDDYSKGMTIKHLVQNSLYAMWLPLPPLAEQKRIVAKIEELLPLIDRYEKAWTRLEDFNKRFPDDMQKSILQMAIQGKLVEQRPEEGTAEDLYKQIQSEKQSLIKAGKIKKEKPLPPITDDEIPFEIPENWKWVRVASLFNVGTGMTPLKSDSRFYLNGTIPWVNSALTSQRYIKHVDTYITQYALQNTSLSLYPAHTIIIAMYGQGKTRGQTSELLIPATINQACAALDSILFFQEMVDFVYFYFQYNYEILRKKAEGTSQPNLNLQKIKETLIPLPPLAEQKRIVTKIEELLPLCERLKKD